MRNKERKVCYFFRLFFEKAKNCHKFDTLFQHICYKILKKCGVPRRGFEPLIFRMKT